jgi:hypothetical protein
VLEASNNNRTFPNSRSVSSTGNRPINLLPSGINTEESTTGLIYVKLILKQHSQRSCQENMQKGTKQFSLSVSTEVNKFRSTNWNTQHSADLRTNKYVFAAVFSKD